MRRLDVREWGFSEQITRLVIPSSDGIPPTLPLHPRELNWWLNETDFELLPNFISPGLTKIVITTNAFARSGETVESWGEDLPDEVAPVMRSAIKLLPPSLHVLRIQLGIWLETHLTEEISAFVLRCGEALRELNTNSVMSSQAIVHLMKLPNLLDWTTEQGPPQVTELIRHGVPDGATSLLPSLKVLRLRGEAALEWLSLLADAKSRTPPWVVAGDGLAAVTYYHPSSPIDSSLISRLLPLTELVKVKINMECLFRPCVSRFTDQDVERLTIALPKLKVLVLGGWPCDSDTCSTTIRSLYFLSIHCMKLKFLNIHFRTANLRTDMLDLLRYAYSQNLHSKPRCALKTLVTQQMPLGLLGYDIALIPMGMLIMFPSLAKFVSKSPVWSRLERLVNHLGRTPGPVEVLTVELMRCLNNTVESTGHGVLPVSTHVSLCGPVRLLVSRLICFRRTTGRNSIAGRSHRRWSISDSMVDVESNQKYHEGHNSMGTGRWSMNVVEIIKARGFLKGYTHLPNHGMYGSAFERRSQQIRRGHRFHETHERIRRAHQQWELREPLEASNTPSPPTPS